MPAHLIVSRALVLVASLGPAVATAQPAAPEVNIGAWMRYWATPRFWFQAGVGSARAGTSSEDRSEGSSTTYEGVSILGAAGFEVIHRAAWALELTGRGAVAGYGLEPA